MFKGEGYGYNFTKWDELVKEKFKDQLEKLGSYKYQNLEVFKSPKGKWMAFHNSDYMDIKVVDLETLEVVTTNFYSNAVYDTEGKYDKNKSTYAHHTNTSTFVPTYLKESYKSSVYNRECPYLQDITELDEEPDWNKLVSIPIAFNVWVTWGDDWGIQVDVLDLREIDNGIIKLWDHTTSFIIPHEANHVRNYIKFNAESWINMETKEDSADKGEYTIDFTILQERTRDRFNVNLNTQEVQFRDMCKKEKEQYYKPVEELPWQAIAKRIEEYRTKRNK